MLNWQWVLSDILGENSIKKRRSNSFQKAFERRLCFDRMVGVTGIFERISFLLQKSLFVFHDHRISFCGIYIDPESLKPIFLDEMSEKYWEKPEFKKLLDHANSLDNLLEQQFDCVYLAGGHGAMYDFPDNEALKTIVRKQDESGRIVSAICHGVSGLLNVKLSNGEYMIKGKKLTGFSWFEESLARRKEDVPFDLEALLKERGADYEKALIPMTSKVVVDNNLITGQDPFSSKEMAKVVMRQLNKAQ